MGQAQEFSADVVYSNTVKQADAGSAKAAAMPPSTRIFVSKDRMRLELRGMINQVMLVDVEKPEAYTLYPNQKAYSPLGSMPPQYFWVTDAENACGDWQKAVGKEISCQKVGPETVDGRSAIKYKGEGPAGQEHVWVDTKLKFVIKWDADNAGAELHNVKEAPQADQLFQIPADYEVLQPKKKPPKMGKRPK